MSLPELEINHLCANPSAVHCVGKCDDLGTHAAYLAPLAC